ncbi:MAG: SUMF1/EgtB/PvdO family nonheme iron enzyme [Anaerolineae bacterium]|nr:SUMF1/EgtB/PvdO family nonheme iron enzyme [Anaerolineae bacterium]
MAEPTPKQLHQFILDCFNDDDLDLFCLEYFGDALHSFGSGMSRSKKALELVTFCQRRAVMDSLLAALQKEREKVYRERFATQPGKRVALPPVYTPQPRNPKQIFISHSSVDADLAHQIAHDLQTNGYDIFITPDSIHPGEKWGPAIDRGLDESGIFVALLTPHAVASAWVNDETYAAIEMANKDEMRLLFLDVQPCQVPRLWSRRQFLSFRGEAYDQNLDGLLNALAGKTARPAARIVVPPTVTEQPRQIPKAEANRFVHNKTGLEFVWIPAGEFLYGDDKKPRQLPEYWISKTPVTQAVYQRFIAANPKRDVPFRGEDWAKPYNWDAKKRTYPADKTDHPVVLVSWYDAIAFCEWAGLQLPTEEQWEKAARGTDGRTCPWGNNEPTDKLCNFNKNVGGTTPVGQYSPQSDSPDGCVDMSGNVWEWCLNKYEKPEDTGIDQSNASRVLRGGSWRGGAGFVRAAVRHLNLPVYRHFNLGFRVVVVRPPSQ